MKTISLTECISGWIRKAEIRFCGTMLCWGLCGISFRLLLTTHQKLSFSSMGKGSFRRNEVFFQDEVGDGIVYSAVWTSGLPGVSRNAKNGSHLAEAEVSECPEWQMACPGRSINAGNGSYLAGRARLLLWRNGMVSWIWRRRTSVEHPEARGTLLCARRIHLFGQDHYICEKGRRIRNLRSSFC